VAGQGSDGGAVLDAIVADRLDAGGAYRLLDELGLSDGLPVGDPAPALLDSMLVSLGRDPDEVMASVPPLRGRLTGSRLATCAALAGCDPEHLAPIAAAISALTVPALNALGVLTTTSSAAFMAVVNGPARRRLRFNSGSNFLGPGNRSNAVVGRCISLVTRIIGGARESAMDMATMGQPGKYSFCFAEDEESSPWAPLHVDRGRAEGTSAITLVAVGGTVEAFESHSPDPGDMIASLAPVLAATAPAVTGVARGVRGGGNPVVLVSPEWAATFAGAGMAKRDLQQALFERAILGDDGLRVAAAPEDILVVVAGGVGVKQTIAPAWAGGSVPITVAF
jgi:hypothetical protein